MENQNLLQYAVTTRRHASIIAGVSLILMALLAPFAYFNIIKNVINPQDAVATFTALTQSLWLVRIAVFCLAVVIFLDILVSWAQYIFLKRVHQDFSLLCALFRLVYSGILAVATARLLDVFQLVSASSANANLELYTQVLNTMLSFNNIWNFGLIFFGIHLFFLGYLIFNLRGRATSIFGFLIVVAGFGYVFDSIALIFIPANTFSIAMFTFFGELILPFWLLIKGGENDLKVQS